MLESNCSGWEVWNLILALMSPIWKDVIKMTHTCETSHTIWTFLKADYLRNYHSRQKADISRLKGVDDDGLHSAFNFHWATQKNNLLLSFFFFFEIFISNLLKVWIYLYTFQIISEEYSKHSKWRWSMVR